MDYCKSVDSSDLCHIDWEEMIIKHNGKVGTIPSDNMNNNFEFLWNVNGPPVAAMMNVNSNGDGEDHTGVSEEVAVKIPCVSPHGRRMDTCNPRDESRACRDTIAAVNEVYRFDGEHVTLGGKKMSNTQFDGAVVLPPIIIDGRETAGNFRV